MRGFLGRAPARAVSATWVRCSTMFGGFLKSSVCWLCCCQAGGDIVFRDVHGVASTCLMPTGQWVVSINLRWRLSIRSPIFFKAMGGIVWSVEESCLQRLLGDSPAVG